MSEQVNPELLVGQTLTVKWFDGCPMRTVRILAFLGRQGANYIFDTDRIDYVVIHGKRSLQRAIRRKFVWISEVRHGMQL